MVTVRARFNPLTALALLLIVGGGYRLLGDRLTSGASVSPCDPAEVGCADEPVMNRSQGRTAAPPALQADEVCRGAGYLCAELEQQDRIRVQRWKDFDGTLVVHVPRPDFEDSGAAIELQRAAAQGLRAWNNQPFPILVDMRGDRDPHFAVRWSSSLGGAQIGQARTQWSLGTGITVLSIELTTRSPYSPGQVSAARQIRLTAAHEMGHALGLGHSDSSRDVMYPTNTATAVSAQDRRTMEVLYSLDNGAEIVR